MLKTIINLLNQKPITCQRTKIEINTKEKDLYHNTLLNLAYFFRTQTKERITIFRTKTDIWHIGIGAAQQLQEFSFVLKTIDNKHSLHYTPKILFILNNKNLEINVYETSFINGVEISTINQLSAFLLANLNSFTDNANAEEKKYLVDLKELELIPSFKEFDKSVNTAQEFFTQDKNFSKVVLSRMCKFPHTHDKDEIIFGILKNRVLHEKSLTSDNSIKSNYIFAFIANDNDLSPFDENFISFTPETLFAIKGNKLYTEALAGSAVPYQDENLLCDNKNFEENRIVAQSIVDDVKDLCLALEVKPAILRKLAYITHILTPIEGNLKDATNAIDILNALYPTPAILGYPKNIANSFINKFNNIEKKLFSGTVGIINETNSEFIVLLRSAHISQNSIKIYAGAGIMPTSSSRAEWLETGIKMTPILQSYNSNLLDIIKNIVNALS